MNNHPFHLIAVCLLLLTWPTHAQVDELKDGEYWNPGINSHVENGYLLITGVTKGTAADHFGLKVNDKIMQVNERRGFKNTDSFNRAFYTEANTFYGCLLLQVERNGKTHQRLIMCDVIWEEDGQWKRRQPRHGRLAGYVMLLGSAINTYETAFDDLPQPKSIREMLNTMSTIVRQWSDAIGLVGTRGLPEDLRRTHQKMVSQLFSASERIRIINENASEAHIMGVVEREMQKVMDTATELHALGQYYNNEDKRQRGE